MNKQSRALTKPKEIFGDLSPVNAPGNTPCQLKHKYFYTNHHFTNNTLGSAIMVSQKCVETTDFSKLFRVITPARCRLSSLANFLEVSVKKFSRLYPSDTRLENSAPDINSFEQVSGEIDGRALSTTAS